MWPRNLIAPLNPRSSRPPACRRDRRRRRSACRVSVEALDDRCLLSTFTVTNLLDGGAGSLRAAIAGANANPGADAINFATTGTIALTGGQLDIGDGLTINGPGVNALTVSGSNASRVFALAGSPTVLIADLTISNGWTAGSPGGGLAMAGGTLTLSRCTVSGNSAVGITSPYDGSGGQGAGGGLSIAGGTLTLNQCIVSGNYAFGGSGDGSFFAQSGGPGGPGEGGGLHVAGGVVNVNQSTFSGNSAIGGPGGDSGLEYWAPYGADTYGGDGGAAAGGGIHVAAGTAVFSQSSLSGNGSAGGGGGAGAYPGRPGVGVGGGLSIAPNEPPIAYLDTSTVGNTINNTPDNIAGPYFLDGVPPPPELAIGDVAVLEGNGGTTAFVFTVRLSAPSGRAVTVGYATANGTATSAGDFAAASGTLTIPAGQTSGTITILVQGDRLGEADETFVVNLSGPTDAVIADGHAAGTIQDDEPRVTIAGESRPEGNSGISTFVFTVVLSRAYDEPVTVSYATTDGSATAGSDYQAKTGTLTFVPGETSKTIAVLVYGDRIAEAQFENFFVDLGGAANAVLLSGRGGSTIQDDEPHISVNDVIKAEGRKGKTTLFTFTVTLSAAYDQPVTMSFRTANGSATTGDGDYVARTGTLTFTPGETTKTITIEVKGDSAREGDETFYLDLFSNSSNSLFTNTRGIGWVLNDD